MSLRRHAIVEANHRLLNPLSQGKLELLGEICRLNAEQTQLDLACGKGEMLCQWSARFGITGVGVDIAPAFLNAARSRAHELGVSDKLRFERIWAEAFLERNETLYDVVSCIGATWIGGGFRGTLEHMKSAAKANDSLLLVGEPYWNQPPPDDAEVEWGESESLGAILESVDDASLELVEMVIANRDDWDRYEVSKWLAMSNWLREHPDDPDAGEFSEWKDAHRSKYLRYERQYLGWGVFVIRGR